MYSKRGVNSSHNVCKDCHNHQMGWLWSDVDKLNYTCFVIIVRDTFGKFVAARVHHLTICFRVDEGETIWIKQLNMERVIVKISCDVILFISCILSNIDVIIQSCELIMESNKLFKLIRIRRETNIVTQYPVRIVRDYHIPYWVEPPTLVIDVPNYHCFCN